MYFRIFHQQDYTIFFGNSDMFACKIKDFQQQRSCYPTSWRTIHQPQDSSCCKNHQRAFPNLNTKSAECTTVDSTVSSMLYTPPSIKVKDICASTLLSKNYITFVSLKALVMHRLVFSSFRSVKFGFISRSAVLSQFLRACYQSSYRKIYSVVFCHNRMPADGIVYMSFRNSV